MKTISPRQHLETGRAVWAFTLIELLVVIAVVAILAGLIIPITGAVQKTKIRTKARAELAEVATWIESYKAKMGHYPPDNPNNPLINPLFYELAGTTLDVSATAYRALNNLSEPLPRTEVLTTFGIAGFVNSVRGAVGEDSVGARSFVREFKHGRTAELPNKAKILTCSVVWPTSNPWQPTGEPGLNPFRYRSSNPTNNLGGFDLWVDVIVAGKTNRVCNWSKEPIIVGTPF